MKSDCQPGSAINSSNLAVARDRYSSGSDITRVLKRYSTRKY